ncbi:PAS domain-containing protein [Flavobacterium sp. CHNK8]|uniref:ATP-binding protein n=1 Tax=Flavobacterium sp. CHNK8 TaxID=2871165 RepID=UPI001C8D5B82|nr:ATP-binding protein [Flavobacterium sp. CHNK8]QZK91011.1 PAS domain-containing protein [Flavobacterium sp. CHNK8]
MDEIFEIVENIFSSGGFMPRWICGQWSETLGWLYIISNIAIGLAYLSIPIFLYKFVKKRKEKIFNRVFICFMLFIFFCGTTHFVDAIIFWFPLYRLNAVVLSMTALISWITVLVLYRFLPIASQYRSPADLQLIIEEQTRDLAIAYQKLSISENQFKTLVNSNPDIITRIDKNLTYQFINNSIRKIQNMDAENIIGKNIREVRVEVDNQINESFIRHVESVFKTNKTETFEFEMNTNENQHNYFQLSIIPLENKVGELPEDVLTITRNITHQKLYEQELKRNINHFELLADGIEKKRKILEDFTYIVSHNLRSPVANLAALLNLLKDETDDDMRNMFIEKIDIAFQSLSTTVNDLTNVVRIRQDSEIPKEELFFQDILSNHLINLETQINETATTITYDFNACEKIDYPKVYLESVFLNLLTNAIKYSSPKRAPQIIFKSFIDKDGMISLTCEDNGMGINLEKHGAKLFGLNKTFHEHPDAKGAGLFITKNQIETMGGAIYAESEVDKGSKFIIYFNVNNS